MAFQGHYNHLYQFSVIADGHRATEAAKQARLKQQQKRQVIQENLALTKLQKFTKFADSSSRCTYVKLLQ